MTLPRNRYVQEGKKGIYHCYCRCVRQAYLYGYDTETGHNYSHRKEWIVERLRQLAGIFAIEVFSYSVMENHYHTILRTRPDVVDNWTDHEVATRWLELYPRYSCLGKAKKLPIEERIQFLANWPERIATLRKRLSSLSWFMGKLNEYIARAANKEDGVKGRFWESRFKCQALLDEAAIAACMVYVALNPIRAGQAATPEESDFTSIQERIREWQKGKTAENTNREDFLGDASYSAGWLCPISPNSQQHGILPMTLEEYFDLVDKSGRLIRSDKRGAIDDDLEPILQRIRANPETWAETVSTFGTTFSLVAGLMSNIRNFAEELGKKWFAGFEAARKAFL